MTAWSLTLSDYLNQSTVIASSSQFEVDTSNNVDSIQIIPNAELIIVKEVVNDDGGVGVLGDFSIATDAEAASGSVLTFDAGVTAGSTTTYTSNTLYIPPGAYSLTEADVDGYAEGSWSCTEGAMMDTTFSSGSVTLSIGQQTVCTIVNDDIAPTLTLAKSVTNDNGGLLTDADFSLEVDGNAVTSGDPTTVLANTSITISEAIVPGYTEGAWECVDNNSLTGGLPLAGAAAGESIVLASGADVTCSITNDDIAPTLTLVKNVVNDNGGDGVIADFDISVDGAVVSSGVATTVLANEIITISELDLAAYAEGTWACVDANTITTGLPGAGVATGTDITLLPGSDVTCSITNNDLGIDLSIAKSVDDATPNIGQTITFSLEITNAGPDVATDVTVVDPVPAGFTYVGGSIGGGDAFDESDPAGAGLSWTLNSVPVGTPIFVTFDAVVNAP